ncbi:extracellular signal-regulated kinase 2 [Asbolus verrucosus]|uniref:Mitogen-activated protein kinase n=1 Tax=Asbolus verrucosus TaxID=1661398 RepID=A0A482W198_ASBVE|nr:extracellular signal-regulated kinase 2 [Asbolus verrucosus]
MPHPKEKIFEIDEHISKRFDIQKRLGKGAYGIVWKAIDRKTKEVVAVKKIFDAFRNQTDAQRTFREIMFLQSLKNHPNIVKLHSIHRAANNSDIYLGFEYMETDLHNVIKKGILKDIHKKYIMYQLLKAIKYIHSGNVIHRDLKPSNILLDIMCRCKIADFGLARSLTQNLDGTISETDPTLTDYVATRWYRAPEILIANRRYTKGIDMWSLGCILAEITAGKPIFPGSSTVNQVEKIMATIPTPSQEDINLVCVSGVGTSMIKNASSADKVPLHTILGKNVCKAAISLINKLLVFNPNKRLTAEEALEHDYVSAFHDPDQEIILSRDIVIPFNDDVRLSVEDYRNKLYEIMSSHHNRNNKTLCKNKAFTPELPARVSKNYGKPPSRESKSYGTQSEPKINFNSRTSHVVSMIKSDSKVVTKQNIQFPKNLSCNKTQISNDRQYTRENGMKKRFSNGKTGYSSYNNYNQSHGIISQSTLMGLKAAGLR